MKNDEAHLRLTIDVHYELGRTDIKDLERVLVAASEHLADTELLSGETEASVLSWDSEVSICDSDDTQKLNVGKELVRRLQHFNEILVNTELDPEQEEVWRKSPSIAAAKRSAQDFIMRARAWRRTGLVVWTAHDERYFSTAGEILDEAIGIIERLLPFEQCRELTDAEQEAIKRLCDAADHLIAEDKQRDGCHWMGDEKAVAVVRGFLERTAKREGSDG